MAATKKPEKEEEWEDVEEGDDDDAESEEEDTSLNNPDVVQKYKLACGFCNQALEAVVKAVAAGKTALELCNIGDQTVQQLCSSVFKKKGENKVDRGLAFPTCVNINNIVCHFSPFEGSDMNITLSNGDVVRIDLGVHIDGYCAVAAHTVVVQDAAAPIEGKLADAVAAAQLCMDTAVHALRPGNKNTQIADLWAKITESFGVTLCEGVLSHELKRFVIDGNNVVLSKPTVEQKAEDVTFETAQVWAIDVVLTTGQGKLREGDCRPFVYKRAPDAQYLLKTKAGREVLNEVNQKFQQFPFAVRSLDAKGARLGVAEALKHDLLNVYPVLYEKAGENVAHFKTTVLITNQGIEKATGLPLTQTFKSDKTCDAAEVKEALSRSLKLVKKNNKKKKDKKKEKKAAAGGDGAAAAAASA